MSGFCNSAFKTWGGCLHAYYQDHIRQLLAHDETLTLPFPNSIFTAAAFNFGPQTVCNIHTDYANLPFGWCSIWSMGNFNHKKGGHLVLLNLHMVIEFPSGSLTLLTSGSCRHGNTCIQPHETRYSWMQFSAGQLFGYMDRRFQTEYSLRESIKGNDEELEREAQRKNECWHMGVGLFSNISGFGEVEAVD
ncbi:hypothetical protein V5O48_017820 [Marasmius crinis-equi]|uniref:Uncharacterized protein n=1 Tax=Marasmius crinis-equi TaxID=585013 RepID=A0ABR3EMX4_9AGAR